ncbi:hypothetical protein ACI2UC_03500 [Ralstonia nicotianae]
MSELLPCVIDETWSLIEQHAAFIRTGDFNGVWIVEVPKGFIEPKIVAGQADGDFAVLNHGRA